jgi:hypothetical protein
MGSDGFDGLFLEKILELFGAYVFCGPLGLIRKQLGLGKDRQGPYVVFGFAIQLPRG